MKMKFYKIRADTDISKQCNKCYYSRRTEYIDFETERKCFDSLTKDVKSSKECYKGDIIY